MERLHEILYKCVHMDLRINLRPSATASGKQLVRQADSIVQIRESERNGDEKQVFSVRIFTKF